MLGGSSNNISLNQESNRQLINRKNPDRSELPNHNINQDQSGSLKDFDLGVENQLVSRDDVMGGNSSLKQQKNKIFKPISLNQIDPSDLEEDEQYESNFMTVKGREDTLELTGQGLHMNNLEYDPSFGQQKEALESRNKFISMNLIGTIFSIIVVFGMFDYQKETEQETSQLFIYMNMSFIGLFFGLVQVIWLTTEVLLHLKQYSIQEREEQFKKKDFKRHYGIICTIVMIISIGSQQIYGNFVIKIDSFKDSTAALLCFIIIVSILNYILIQIYFFFLLPITLNQQNNKNKDRINLNIFNEIDPNCYKDFLKSTYTKQKELKKNIQQLSLEFLKQKKLLNKKSQTSYNSQASQASGFRNINNFQPLSSSQISKNIQNQIHEDESFVNPMMTNLTILGLNISMFLQLCLLLFAFTWNRWQKIVYDDELIFFIILSICYPFLTSLIGKISGLFVQNQMHIQNKIKQYTFHIAGFKYGFILLCHTSKGLITIILVKYVWKIVRYIFYPYYIRRQFSRIMYKIGIKTKQLRTWKDLEEKQKFKQYEHTNLVQQFLYCEGTEISYSIATFSMIMIFKGVVESNIINTYFQGEVFENFLIFSCIDIILEVLTLVVCQKVMSRSQYFTSNLQIFDSFFERLNGKIGGNIGFYQMGTDILFSFAVFSLISLNNFTY